MSNDPQQHALGRPPRRWIRPRHLPWVFGATLAYPILLIGLHPYLGNAATILPVFPVILAAALGGARSGVASAFVFPPLTAAGMYAVGAAITGDTLISIALGHVALIFVGGAVGWLHDLRERLLVELEERHLVEAALREAEERWRAVVRHAPNIIIVMDRKARFRFANRSDSDLGTAGLIGTSVYDLIDPDVRGRLRADLARVFEAGETVQGDYPVTRQDGVRAVYRARLAPIYRDGEVESAVVIATDFTADAQLGALRSRFIEKVVFAQEEERRRIARELHDATGQSLTSLLIGLRAVEEVDELATVREQLRGLRQQTSEALDELAYMARALHPPVLEDLGFVPAIERYLSEFASIHGLRPDVQISGLAGMSRLPQPVELTLYRIIQEAFTNVVKHAGASQISLCVEVQGATIRATIEDDGCGFEPDATTGLPKDSIGLGLVGIRERAELVGGSIAVESRPGAGTSLFVSVPIAAEQGMSA